MFENTYIDYIFYTLVVMFIFVMSKLKKKILVEAGIEDSTFFYLMKYDKDKINQNLLKKYLIMGTIFSILSLIFLFFKFFY